MTPDIFALQAAARRERAVEMHRLLVAPIVAFFRKLGRTEPRVAACHS